MSPHFSVFNTAMSSQPSFLPRLAAILIFLFALYGVLFSVRFTTERTRQIGAAHLLSSVKDGDMQRAEQSLSLLSRSFRATDTLPIPPFEPLQQNEWDTALPRMRQKLSVLNELVNDSEVTASTDMYQLSLAPATRAQFSKTVKNLKETRKNLSRLHFEVEALNRSQDGVWTKLGLLMNDFRSILNLPIEEKAQLSSIELYTDGVFLGLPKLPEIPKGPSSSTELKEVLEAKEIPLPKISPEEFQQRLSVLRSSVEKAISELDLLEDQLLELSNQIKGEESSEHENLMLSRNVVLAGLRADTRAFNYLE